MMSRQKHSKSLILSCGLWCLAEGSSFANSFFPGIPRDFFNAQLSLNDPIKRTISTAELNNLPPMSMDKLLVHLGSKKTEEVSRKAAHDVTIAVSPESQLPNQKLQPAALPLAQQAEMEDLAATWSEARHLALEATKPNLIPSQTVSNGTELVIKVQGSSGSFKVTPSNLTIPRVGAQIKVSMENSRGIQIFSRNPKIIRWDGEKKFAQAKGQGTTELYVVGGDQLQIVRLTVLDSVVRDPLLADQNDHFLKDLTSVIPKTEKALTYQDSLPVEKASVSLEKTASASSGLTLADTIAEVDATKALQEEQRSRFVYPELPRYRRVSVQVMDERSVPEQSLIYPAAGLSVRIFGTKVETKSDAKGLAHFGDMPEGSRFWALIEDEKGHYVPSVSELSFPAGSRTEVLRSKTLSYRSYFAYQNVLDVTQDSGLASFCARALDSQGRQILSGIRVALNVKAEGPFYFGSFGPQRGLQATEASGRFCFFNVQPGLSEVVFSDGGGYRTAVTIPLFPGAHTEEDFSLENQMSRSMLFASLPTATEQVYEDSGSHESGIFQSVDNAEVITIGSNESLGYVSPGVYGHERISTFKGRIFALTQTPEFENTVTAIDEDDRLSNHLSVVPFLPRGFTEDLYHELHQQDGYGTIPFDPALGQAIVFHQVKHSRDNVKISIINSSGRTMDEAWYFGNTAGLIKAAFFNLNPGVYQVLVETSQGAILAMDTTVVDYWTTAFVQTGGSVHYSVQAQRHASLEN